MSRLTNTDYYSIDDVKAELKRRVARRRNAGMYADANEMEYLIKDIMSVELQRQHCVGRYNTSKSVGFENDEARSGIVKFNMKLEELYTMFARYEGSCVPEKKAETKPEPSRTHSTTTRSVTGEFWRGSNSREDFNKMIKEELKQRGVLVKQ